MLLEAFMMRSNPNNGREAICEKLIKEAPSTFIDVNKHLTKETNDQEMYRNERDYICAC